MRHQQIRHFAVMFSILVGVACSDEGGNSDDGREELPPTTFQIDTNRITVSGISSGGYMAGQLHIAHSNLFSGVAILAGGPYWCAEGSILKGLGPCLTGDDIDPSRLLNYARELSDAGQIDALANLTEDRVWLFHGANDAVVGAGVVTATADFYEPLVASGGIVAVTDVAAVHGMPTLSVGAACDTMAPPFLNSCDYDAAGDLLHAMYGPLHGRVAADSELRTIMQPGSDNAKMLESAFLYVPRNCADGESCGLHVALHGCQQSSEFIDATFATGAGYNEWAESNDLLVLYPQVASSKVAPANPLGCWDWWGYTGDDYATKAGPQVAAIKSMIDALAGLNLP